MSTRRTLPFLVAVETDPLRYHGEHAHLPSPLPTAGAEQVLAHLAADLARLFPRVTTHRLCGIGALYDQAQILRPDWPLFSALADVARRRWKKDGESAGIMGIGAVDGRMPEPGLEPDPDLPPGILLLLPLQLQGPTDELDALEEDMEHRFMEEGQLSPLSARALENAFGIATTHARFITLTDLRAMLKLQLEHFGFTALSDLLDVALEGDAAPRDVHAASGQHFHWDGSAVNATFETFDHWASEGAGSETPAEGLVEAYRDWTREHRRMLVTLQAHGVSVRQVLAGSGASLEGVFFEEDAGPAAGQAPGVTEHDGGDLGTLVVSVVHDGRLKHFWPLAPEGSNALHAHIATLGLEQAVVAYPGATCIDPAARRLAPDCA